MTEDHRLFVELLTRFETVVAENTRLKAQLERQRLIIDSYERERAENETLGNMQRGRT